MILSGLYGNIHEYPPDLRAEFRKVHWDLYTENIGGTSRMQIAEGEILNAWRYFPEQRLEARTKAMGRDMICLIQLMSLYCLS